MKSNREIMITQFDFTRLKALIAKSQPTQTTLLEAELSRAKIIASEEIPEDVITMNSRVRFKNLVTGDESEIDLVFPHNADESCGAISILDPVGAELLGLAEGEIFEWPLPSGKVNKLKLLSVVYQPEAQGRFEF